MAVKRLLQIRPQLDDGSGVLLNNGRLFFYAAGSSTKQNTYNSSTGAVANANPIVLNARGEIPGEVWGTVGQTYKIGLAIAGSDDPPASFVWTEDNVSGINDLTSSLDEWVSGPAPTFISATSFSLVGDQTTAFHVGRRLKTTNSGGTVYSTIITSAFAALTTITVVNDSGSLDAGLSAVSYGLQAATNPSEPLLIDTFPIVSGSSDKTKKVRLEVDGLTTATTRVITVPDVDLTLPYKPGTYGSMQVYTAGATWTKPAGLVRVKVTVIGGGGGGGGTNNTTAAAGGGGGGGTSIKTIAAATLGATETVTVGAAGAAGANTGGTGGTGGTSSFGAHCSATGGAGGVGSASNNAIVLGGVGGSGSSGDINLTGQSGGPVNSTGGGATAPASSGFGGNSTYGGGSAGVAGAAAGNAGGNYGGGGGGAYGSTALGGAGAGALVFVEEFF